MVAGTHRSAGQGMMDIRYLRRRITNRLATLFAVASTTFGLLWLLWLLWTLLSNGLPWIDWRMFTSITPPPGSAGGLANAIVGSLLLTTGGVLVGVPIGVMAGTFLAEFGRSSPIASVVRFTSDVLLSAPSIILGLFIYQMVVVRMGHFSLWAGVLALALIVVPVMVRATEDILRLVPNSLREAAAALGAPQWKVTVQIVYRAARAGILTGILLAVARISGETAPLLFTALNNQFWSTNFNEPVANLPVVIFQFAMSPYEDWQHLAWAGALLITTCVLALIILARIFLRRKGSPLH